MKEKYSVYGKTYPVLNKFTNPYIQYNAPKVILTGQGMSQLPVVNFNNFIACLLNKPLVTI